MGFLAQAAGGAASGLGFTDPATAATRAVQFGTAGVGAEAGGQFLSGIGAAQQGLYAASVARTNAKIQQQNALAATDAGQYEESAAKLRTGITLGAQRAAQGANNVDVNVGSPVDVRQATADVGALDAAMIHYNAARQAFGARTEAEAFKTQAGADALGALGSVAGGAFKGASTLLSGAASVGAKYAQFGLTGVPGYVPPGKGLKVPIFSADPAVSPLNDFPIGAQ